MSRVILRKKSGERRLVNNNKSIVTSNARTKPTRAFQHKSSDLGTLDSPTKVWVIDEQDSRTQFLNRVLYTHKGVSLDVLKRMSTAANEHFHARDIAAGRSCSTLAARMKRETVWCHLSGCRRKKDLLIINGSIFTGSKREFDAFSHSVNISLVHTSDYVPRTN
jgi:hypothetical protein